MTYTELRQLLLDFASNYETSFESHIPEFVQAAEQRIMEDAALPAQQRATTVPTAIGVADVSLAAVPGYLSVDSLHIVVAGSHLPMDNKTEEYLRAAFPNPSITGQPRLYTIDDEVTIKVAPTPNAVYTLELRYYARPPSIVDADETWLSINFPFALQYGALRDVAVYLKEEADVVAMYEGKYAEAIKQVQAFSARRAFIDYYRTRGQ